MTRSFCFTAAAALSYLLLPWALHAQRSEQPPIIRSAPSAPQSPTNATRGAPQTDVVSEQKSYAKPGLIVAPEKAQTIVDQFQGAYSKLGNPRLLIHLNRGLPPEPGNNNARSGAKPIPLADRQTMRDIERLFGRPLRAAGAVLTDQNAAEAVLGNKSIHALEGADQGAAQRRENLLQVTDMVIEVLFSAKDLTVTELSGDKTYSVPDIQATAIRLQDFAILGQATSNDILGRALSVRRLDANEITEATALALMEDMAKNAANLKGE